MADRVVITTGDLEHAVRINAALESAGFETALATSVDEARQAILRRQPDPDCLGVTGGVHEPSGVGSRRLDGRRRPAAGPSGTGTRPSPPAPLPLTRPMRTPRHTGPPRAHQGPAAPAGGATPPHPCPQRGPAAPPPAGSESPTPGC